MAVLLAFPTAGAWAIDVANQADWNTAMAAVAAAGAGSTVSINVTAGFTLTSSLAQLQAGNANVTVNVTGNSQTINGASAFQGIVVSGTNAPTVNISSLLITDTAARGGSGQNGQNGYFSGGLAYGAGGGGGGGLGAGGGLLVGSGANVTLASVTFTGNTAVGGAGGNGGIAQNAAPDPVNGGNGGVGGAANNGGVSGGGGIGGTGGNTGTQGTTGTAGTGLGDGGGGGGGSGTTNSTTYTPNNNGGSGNANGGLGGQGGDGVTNNNGSGGPGSDGGSGGGGGAAQGGAIYVATGGSLTIMDTPISGASATVGAGGSQGVGQGPNNFSGSPGSSGAGVGAGIFLSGVNATIGVSSGSVTYANQIGGNGLVVGATTTALTKTGNGTLELAAANTFVGNVVINGGTLSIAGTANLGNLANDVRIGDGATLAITGTTTLANGRAVTFAGASSIEVTGAAVATLQGTTADGTSSGSLTKAGAGTLVLSGAGSYTGSTTVSGGTLRLGIATALPNATALSVSTGATFDFNNFSKNIGALGGGGTVMLGSGSLTTTSTDASTFSGAITGSGDLIKAGAGTLVLSGASTYTGATTVNAGTLVQNGSTGSLVTVNTGATLGGSGAIGGASIASGAVFAPGNSIGTMTVNGNVAFASGSTYRVEADAAGNADRINASGTATLGGGTVDVQAAAGTYQPKTLYTIVNATGGVSGNFAGVTSNLAFLTPALAYDANNVVLTLSRNDISFSSVAITPNQSALAAAFQRIAANNTPEMAQVLTALQGTSADGARAAFDSVGGAGITSLHRAGMLFSDHVGDLLNRRLGAIAVSERASQPVLLAANDKEAGLGQLLYAQANTSGTSGLSSAGYHRGLWIRAFGADQNTDSDGNAAGYGLHGGGLSVGFDSEVRDGLVLGVNVTASKSHLSVDGGGGTGRSRGRSIAAYGSYATGPWVLKGIASVGTNDNHMDRTVTVGPIGAVASSDFDGRTQAVYAEAAYDLKMSGYAVQPLAAISYTHLHSDGFTEQGAGALNLLVAGQNTHSTKSLLGVRTAYETGRVRLEPRILWSHEFGDVNVPLNAQLTGAGAAGAFQVSGVQLKRDSLVLGLGASSEVTKNVSLYGDVQVDYNTRQRNVAAFLGVRGAF